MRIDAVDFFYLSMPEVTIAADGSQDALVIRVSAGGHVGWGECEAAPLPSIAAWIAPMSHGACRPLPPPAPTGWKSLSAVRPLGPMPPLPRGHPCPLRAERRRTMPTWPNS